MIEFILFFIIIAFIILAITYLLPAYVLMIVWNHFIPSQPLDFLVAMGIVFLVYWITGITHKINKVIKKTKRRR